MKFLRDYRAVLLALLLFVLLLAALALSRSASPTESRATSSPTMNPRSLRSLYEIEQLALTEGWDAVLHQQAGDWWQALGRPQLALQHWEASLQFSENARLRRRTAELYLQGGAWNRAFVHIERLLAVQPNAPWALFLAGSLIAPTDPQAAEGYLVQAAAHSENEDRQRVIAEMLAVLADVDSELSLSSRVGAALAREGYWSLAENAFQIAAAQQHPFPEALAFVALARQQQGKSGRAWVQDALQRAPENALVQYAAGVYWRNEGDYPRSVSALLTAIILAPENASFYAALGYTHWAAGNIAEANYWLQSAAEMSDDDPVILEALERLRLEESYLLPLPQWLAVTAQRATSEDDPALLTAQGWALHLSGQSEAGLQRIEQALSIDPDYPRALYDKARILLDTGRNPDEAAAILQALAAGDSPFATPARRLLGD